MAGLEHLFAGLVEGIGETTTNLSKEKRDKAERAQQQQTAFFSSLLSNSDLMNSLEPKKRQEIFKFALESAAGGDKKLVEKVNGMLGGLLGQGGGQKGQQQPAEQTAQAPQQVLGSNIPSPTNPMGAAGPQQAPQMAPRSKFEEPSRSIFIDYNADTQRQAQRAAAITGAETQARVDVTQPAEIARMDHASKLEMQQQEAAGNQFSGRFTKPDGTGLVRPIFVNSRTGGSTVGKEPVPESVSGQMMDQTELNQQEAQIKQDQGPNLILQSQGIDPSRATPEQRVKAGKIYGGLQVSAMNADTAAKNANSLESLLRIKYMEATGGKGTMTDAQLATDMDRQWKQHETEASKISTAVAKVDDNKVAADNEFGQAMNIQQLLQGQKRGQEDAELVRQGYTWAAYDSHITKAKSYLLAAEQAGRAAASRFGPKVKFEMGGENGKYPHLEDISPEFIYKSPTSGFPKMPEPGSKRGRGRGAAGKTIDVPDDLLNKLYNNP